MNSEPQQPPADAPTMELVVDGPTPAGGVRSRMVFVDAAGERVAAEDPAARTAVIEELDEQDRVIQRTTLASE